MSDPRPFLSPYGKWLLESRYLRRNDDREIIESPHDMYVRIAEWISRAELEYGGQEDKDKYFWQFLDALLNLEIVPSSPYMFNCGVERGGLFACFVIPIGDSIQEIYKCASDCALVYQATGGIGVDFSPVREEGALVKRSKGRATGPLSFLGVMNSSALAVNHGGHRRAASLAALDINHPDVEEFISVKSHNLPEINKLNAIIALAKDKMLTNFAQNELAKLQEFTAFNFSVKINDEFMLAVQEDKEWELVGRTDSQVKKRMRARDLFKTIVQHAWRSAEPGIIFIDHVNKDNTLPGHGRIECCNPCGEQYLHPYQACNLVTINLNKALNEGKIDWSKLSDLARIATRFSDNAIDVSGYPIPEIEEAVKASRRIGVGIMGLADVLISLGIPYDSEKGRKLASKIMKAVNKGCVEESKILAKERGVFPLWNKSIFAKKRIKVRNCAFTSIQPNGSTSIIADASASAEPLYNVYYIRRTHDGAELETIHPLFRRDIEAAGLDINEIIRKLDVCGSIQGIKEIPDELKAIYRCASDISPEDHVLMQAALQKHVDGGISKTINMPSDATEADVERVYMLAWEHGCKGVTVYRDGCRNAVLVTKSADVQDHERKLAQFLKEKYVIEEKSPRDIAEMLNVSVTTVFTRLKRFGIKRRSVTEVRKAKRKKLSSELRDVVLGNLLATARIQVVEGQGSYRHITKHYDYASHVRQMFIDEGIACADIMEIYTDNMYYYFDTEFTTELAELGKYFFRNNKRVVPDELGMRPGILRHYYLSEGARTEKGGIRLHDCPKKLQGLIEEELEIEVTDKGGYAYIPKRYAEDFYGYIESKELVELREEEASEHIKCPECGSELEFKEKCKTCPQCGWGACSI
jgi:ribonucleoside-diphosphate reductase alpha chain